MGGCPCCLQQCSPRMGRLPDPTGPLADLLLPWQILGPSPPRSHGHDDECFGSLLLTDDQEGGQDEEGMPGALGPLCLAPG